MNSPDRQFRLDYYIRALNNICDVILIGVFYTLYVDPYESNSSLSNPLRTVNADMILVVDGDFHTLYIRIEVILPFVALSEER